MKSGAVDAPRAAVEAALIRTGDATGAALIVCAALLVLVAAIAWAAARFDARLGFAHAFGGAALGGVAGLIAAGATLTSIDRARLFGGLSDGAQLGALVALGVAGAALGALVIGRRIARSK
ncbi:MAG: hypothetical protein JNK46_18155 [Methylobacteriaceae bacterium]|nr:hypothetical protein [Methylobacteriaceae bacterium]